MSDQPDNRLWAVVAALTGLATLAIAIALQLLPEVRAAAGCLPDQAVILFELAHTPDELLDIFGPPGSACRARSVAAMDAVNTLDVWGFVPAYTLFVASSARFLSGGRRTGLTGLAVALALIAAAADYVETLSLLAYTPELAPSAGSLAISSTAARLKFWALSANAASLGALCFSARRRILGGLLCLPLVGTILVALDHRWIVLQTLAFAVGWSATMLAAIRDTARRR